MAVDIVIDDTSNIAQARQALRKLSTEEAWPNMLRVRSIAALTALAEVLYFGDASRLEIPLHICVMSVKTNTEDLHGVEFYARTNFRRVCQHFLTARWQLERASDEMIVQRADDANSDDLVVLRLWALEAKA